MKLISKCCLPVALTVLGMSVLGILIIRGQLDKFEAQVLDSVATEKAREVRNAISGLSEQGLRKAALFSTRWDVIQALELAHMGDMISLQLIRLNKNMPELAGGIFSSESGKMKILGFGKTPKTC